MATPPPPTKKVNLILDLLYNLKSVRILAQESSHARTNSLLPCVSVSFMFLLNLILLLNKDTIFPNFDVIAVTAIPLAQFILYHLNLTISVF